MRSGAILLGVSLACHGLPACGTRSVSRADGGRRGLEPDRVAGRGDRRARRRPRDRPHRLRRPGAGAQLATLPSTDTFTLVGSVDGPFAGTGTFAQTMTATQVMVVPGTFVPVSDTQLMEVALPDATANDLIVSIEAVTFSCGFGPPGTGLLIDDLRVE